jgi:hypothetical protein
MKTEKEWTTRAGLKAVVIAHDMGHHCGYVGVTKDHPWHGKDCNEANLDVHGGVTYAGARDGLWWFGYDCAHLGDAADPDLMSDEYKNVLWSRVLTIGGETIKTLDFCVNECESMATQLGGAVK